MQRAICPALCWVFLAKSLAARGKKVLILDGDLDEILTYITTTLNHQKAAANFVDALDAKYGELEAHPLMFALSQNRHLAQRGYRRFLTAKLLKKPRWLNKCEAASGPSNSAAIMANSARVIGLSGRNVPSV